MKFMRRTAGYSSKGDRRKEDILEELKVDPIERNQHSVYKYKNNTRSTIKETTRRIQV